MCVTLPRHAWIFAVVLSLVLFLMSSHTPNVSSAAPDVSSAQERGFARCVLSSIPAECPLVVGGSQAFLESIGRPVEDNNIKYVIYYIGQAVASSVSAFDYSGKVIITNGSYKELADKMYEAFRSREFNIKVKKAGNGTLTYIFERHLKFKCDRIPCLTDYHVKREITFIQYPPGAKVNGLGRRGMLLHRDPKIIQTADLLFDHLPSFFIIRSMDGLSTDEVLVVDGGPTTYKIKYLACRDHTVYENIVTSSIGSKAAVRINFPVKGCTYWEATVGSEEAKSIIEHIPLDMVDR